MSTKHTAGKWRFNENDGFIYTGTSTKIACVMSKDSEEEEDANAKLIASAPELLRLLKLINARLDIEQKEAKGDVYFCASFHKDIKQEIQKATS